MKRLAALALLLLLAGCNSEAPKPETGGAAPAAKPTQSTAPQLETGREAFQRTFAAARGWAGDARPYRLQSLVSANADGHDGKTSVWVAGFASTGRGKIKSYTWSGTHDPNAPEYGVSETTEDTYNPSNSSTRVFDIAFLKVDSDKAFDVAQKHGGDRLLKKDPKLPVYYALDWEQRENVLLWHVMYGGRDTEAKLKIAVDATTGIFTRVEH